MDSFEANKIFGALLGTVFVLFGGSLLAESIFHSEVPEQFGYAIEAQEESAGGAAPEVAAVPIATLLQTADAEAGSTVFRRCQSCHSNEDGAPAGVGPHLWDVVNREIAHDPGFSYSAAMTEFAEGGSVVWDYDHLDHFLRNPRQYISGTAMGFAGISNDSDRANLIAYLRTLSNDPAPLPEPPAEEAAAPAEGETDSGTTTDAGAPAGDQPQAPATTDPGTGAAPASEAAPTTGEATDADAAQPSEAAPAEGTAPAEEPPAPADAPAEGAAPAQESGESQPQGTTIVPAQ
ncbi:c-type cytochrome [Aureimonas mangrovi]|uniref:c-type cytochrome n=1 Tax=Aureimonas mangrovi TaxID=2758041 RepID=UPI00163D8618|nr:cytochrome c family protein [Aureimonas mangrovi]